MNLNRIYDIYDNIYNILPAKYPKPKLTFYEDCKCMHKAFLLKVSESSHMIYDYSSRSINIPVLEIQQMSDNDIMKVLLHEIYHAYVDANRIKVKSNEESLANSFSTRWAKKINPIDNKIFLGWTKDELAYLKQNYPWGSVDEIVKKLGKRWDTIKVKANTIGLKRVNRSEYSCDHLFFSPLHNKYNMWVAGFIASKGCARQNNSNIKIDVSYKDIDILYKIKKLIRFDGDINVYTKNSRKYGVLSFSSKQVVSDLEKYFNITLDKVKAFYATDKLLQSEHFSHFLRGYSDGCGYFYVDNKSGAYHIRYSIVGTEIFMSQIVEHLYNIGINKVKIKKNRDTYTIKYARKNSIDKLSNYMYSNCDDIYLKRKREILSLPCVEKYIDKKYKSIVRINPITGDKIKFNSIKEAIALGYTRSGIYYACTTNKLYSGFYWKYFCE